MIFPQIDSLKHQDLEVVNIPQEQTATKEDELFIQEQEEDTLATTKIVEKEITLLKTKDTASTQQTQLLEVPVMDFQSHSLRDFLEFRNEYYTNQKGVDFTLFYTEQPVNLPGIAGDPLPYRLRNDVFITSTLLLSLFFALFIISRSLHVFILQIKDFFYNKDRNETIMLNRDSEMKTQTYVNLLSCFLLSIVFFNYSEYALPDVFNRISPYKLLLLDIAVFAFYFLSKMIAYRITNWTFFPQQNIIQWNNAYNLMSLVKALMFFPIALIVVYFDIPMNLTLWITSFVILCFEILAIFKAKQIFFSYNFGIIHLFLYFCTLEFTPLILLWATLVLSNELTIVYI